MDNEKLLIELNMQEVRLIAFNDGYKAAMKYVMDLLKEKPTNGTGIPADSGNTSSPS